MRKRLQNSEKKKKADQLSTSVWAGTYKNKFFKILKSFNVKIYSGDSAFPCQRFSRFFSIFPDYGVRQLPGVQVAGHKAVSYTGFHCCPGGPLSEKGWRHCVTLSWEGAPWCWTEEIISAENGIPLSCEQKDLSGYIALDHFCSSVHTLLSSVFNLVAKGVKISFKDTTSTLTSLTAFLYAQATLILPLQHKNSALACKTFMHLFNNLIN